jgi:FAD/FMN-containing dehydrogenase
MVDSKEIIDGLAEIIGRDFVKTKPEIVSEYAVDKVSPMAVLFPKNTQQVSEIVKLANLRNLAIVPRGSGSKMSFGNPPKRLDLVLCTTRMNHMLDVDTANLTITVEAGVKFRDVQARLATEDDRCYLPLEDLATEGDEFICSDRSHSGCFLPIDPGDSFIICCAIICWGFDLSLQMETSWEEAAKPSRTFQVTIYLN